MGGLWSQVEKHLHINVLELKAVIQETSADSIGQHHCSSPHKQTGKNQLNRTLCPHVETPHRVQQTPDNPQGKTCPRFTQCHCEQSFQEKPNSTHRVVPVPSDIQTDHSTLGTSSDRLSCHQPKHKSPNLCVSHSRPTSLGGGCTEHFLEEHNRLRFSSNSTITKSGPEIIVPRM